MHKGFPECCLFSVSSGQEIVGDGRKLKREDWRIKTA